MSGLMCVSPCGHAPMRGRASAESPRKCKSRRASRHDGLSISTRLGPGPVLVNVLGNGNYILTSTRESRGAHVKTSPNAGLRSAERSERANYNQNERTIKI